MAEEFVKKHGGLPQDAKLTRSSVTVRQNLETGLTEPMEFYFEYTRDYKGISVTGAGGDAIKIAVSDQGMNYYFRLWRKMGKELKAKHLMTAREAIMAAADELAASVKSEDPLIIKEVRLVYGTPSFDSEDNVMEPCWQVVFDKGRSIDISAATGRVKR